MNIIYNILLFLLYAIFSGTGLILLKLGLSNTKLSLPLIIGNPKIIFGFLLYACGFLLWMYILSKFKLNVAFPIAMSSFFIISNLGSFFILKESFSIQHILGIILCFCGILLISVK